MTARVARAAFPKGTLCLRIRDTLGPVFSDEQFAGLFAGRGRPGLSPARLVWVLVLQFAEDLTDRQAADAVRSRIDWKYLLGLELDDPGFDFSVLSEFRDRLLDADAARQVLDTLLARLVAAKLLKPGGKARTDSTHVLAAVRVLNRLENVFTTLQAALEQLAQIAPGWLGSWLPPDWQALYGSPLKLPRTGAARTELGARIGEHGHRLWTELTGPDAPAGLLELPAVQVLRLVWVQQYLLDEPGRVRWRSPGGGGDGLPPASIRIDSPFDVQAHHAVKRGMSWTGYKDHYTETCGDPDIPHLITDVETTLGPVHDGTVLPGIHARLAARTLTPGEHLVDSGYAAPEAVRAARADYGITLIAPLLADHSWQATAGDGFDQASFTVDWHRQQVSCPAGATSRRWRLRPDDPGGPRIHVAFATNDCRPCPSRDQCVKSTRPRQLTLHPQAEHEILLANRADQTSRDWQTRYARRAGVEGTISQAVAHGARHARYIGLAKKQLQTILTATGLNLIRLNAWLTGTPHARTRTSPITRLTLTPAA